MTTLYVDVSHHDWNRRGGNLDWPRVLSVSSPVMVARATYGDPARFAPPTYHFADFQRGAAAAEFTVRGAYHNLIRGDAASMRRQVDWFRRTLESQGCHWAMVDVERYKELLETGNQPGWDDVRRWRDAWYAVESRPMVWYLPRWVWSYWSFADLRELRGPLIQSHYLTGVYGSPTAIYNAGGGDSGTGWDDVYGGRLPDIWQYSATCDVAGASSQTDVNAFRGSVDQLTALLTGGDMEQAEKLRFETANAPGRTVGQVLTDVSELRDGLIGAGEFTAGLPGQFPKAGSAAWNMIHLPELLKQHAAAPVDQAMVDAAVLAAVKAALLDPQVLAAVAKAVADEDHRRSAE